MSSFAPNPLQQIASAPSGSPSEHFGPLGKNIKVLMVWPRFPPSFWGFEGVLELLPERSVMPPLGLITVAALCPPSWEIRLLDRAFEDLRDEDILWADLLMVSAMHAQREDTLATLAHARRLGRRTFIGGPWASSEPELLLRSADHVLAGEAEEVLADIAKALENGTAQRLYRVIDKPDMTRSPVPRFELLQLSKYTSMPIQFSRGCPFQCEFCDIITIYGRRPRAKTPVQVMEELDTLLRLGWRSEVFIVDDNFIGNQNQALALSRELAEWQTRVGRCVYFCTEASVNLAAKPDLMDAMVQANFMYVFLGIETPSAEALKGSFKFQNLRGDIADQIRTIRKSGLWVLGGFIVGFDSDDESIFDRQLEFISRTAIPWAMAGVLQAPPTTALYDRMKREGRLFEDSQATSNFSPPNFRTNLPLPVLLHGLSYLLSELYRPKSYFARSIDSIESWHPSPSQKPPTMPMSYNLRVMFSSIWRQGICSNYRLEYWRFIYILLRRWATDPARMWLGTMALLTAHHFINYAKVVTAELEEHCRTLKHIEPCSEMNIESPGLEVPFTDAASA
jgi:radical SAM superfamily enzyme YgiQ (UPF0313 family)